MYHPRGKKRKSSKHWNGWPAMCSHIPDKSMQMVHYYGFYSNVTRGKRKKADQDGLIPSIMEDKGSPKEYRKNWDRLIQKIFEVDPLVCPKHVLSLSNGLSHRRLQKT
jgi:hypothetical protein